MARSMQKYAKKNIHTVNTAISPILSLSRRLQSIMAIHIRVSANMKMAVKMAFVRARKWVVLLYPEIGRPPAWRLCRWSYIIPVSSRAISPLVMKEGRLAQPTEALSFSAFSASWRASMRASMSPSMKAGRLCIE